MVPGSTVESIQLVQAYLPAVTVSTLREGMMFEGIEVSQDDPRVTAQNIENAIRGGATIYGPIGPVDFPLAVTVGLVDDHAPRDDFWGSDHGRRFRLGMAQVQIGQV